MQYIVSIDDESQFRLEKMITDNSFWPSKIPPHSFQQLIKWAVDDYLDVYDSYLRSQKDGQ